MGIYTAYASGSTLSTDIYSPAEREIQTEGVNVNFHALGLEAVAESESYYNNIMKSVGIAELRYFEEHGTEVVYEAADIGAFFNKIKMFFKKIIDKIKAIFHAFMAKLTSFTKDSKKFAEKYEKEFVDKWTKIKSDLTFKGFNFTIPEYSDNDTILDIDRDILSHLNKGEGGNLTSLFIADGTDGIKLADNLVKKINNAEGKTSVGSLDDEATKYSDYIKKNRENIQDTIRSTTVSKLRSKTSLASKTTPEKIDSSDFSKELFISFRNGEDQKEDIEASKLNSIDIINDLKTGEKSRKAAEKCTKAATKTVERCIKTVDNFEKDLRSENAGDKAASNTVSHLLTACNEFCSILRFMSECVVTANSALSQAITDRAHQYKAIVAKVVAGGKKITEESYSYTNEGGSFLDAVVIK